MGMFRVQHERDMGSVPKQVIRHITNYCCSCMGFYMYYNLIVLLRGCTYNRITSLSLSHLFNTICVWNVVLFSLKEYKVFIVGAGNPRYHVRTLI